MKAHNQHSDTNLITLPTSQKSPDSPTIKTDEVIFTSLGLDRVCSSKRDGLHFLASAAAILNGLTIGSHTKPSERTTISPDRFNLLRVRSASSENDPVAHLLHPVCEAQSEQQEISEVFEKSALIKAWKDRRAEDISQHSRTSLETLSKPDIGNLYESLFGNGNHEVRHSNHLPGRLSGSMDGEPLKDRQLLERLISPTLVLRSHSLRSILEDVSHCHRSLPIIHLNLALISGDNLEETLPRLLALAKGTDLSICKKAPASHIKASIITDFDEQPESHAWDSANGVRYLNEAVCLTDAQLSRETLSWPKESNQSSFTERMRLILTAKTEERYNGKFHHLVYRHPDTITCHQAYLEPVPNPGVFGARAFVLSVRFLFYANLRFFTFQSDL